MEIPVKDKSNYLKGLLIVAKKDKQLADSEKRIIRGIGEKLGFASRLLRRCFKGFTFK